MDDIAFAANIIGGITTTTFKGSFHVKSTLFYPLDTHHRSYTFLGFSGSHKVFVELAFGTNNGRYRFPF